MEEDLEEEEESYITVSGGKVVEAECAEDDDGEVDNSNTSSPDTSKSATMRQLKRRQKLARDYADNLKRLHEYQETRPEVGNRLKKWGLTADYAKTAARKDDSFWCIQARLTN